VELVRLDEPLTREDLEAVCSVHELELPIRRVCVAFEHEGPTATAPRAFRPHIHGASTFVDVTSDLGSRDELHVSKFRVRECETALRQW